VLLDEVLPQYHVREVHELGIEATPDAIYEAIENLTPQEVPIAGLLMGLRSLPARISGRRLPRDGGPTTLLHQMRKGGFVALESEPGQENVLLLVGQFWKLRGGTNVRISNRDEFREFNDPRFARAAINFLVVPQEAIGMCRLRTETRVSVPGRAARRRFLLYWAVIRPWSGLIRHAWLRAVKRRAEGITK
jgi:hypothetical protein